MGEPQEIREMWIEYGPRTCVKPIQYLGEAVFAGCQRQYMCTIWPVGWVHLDDCYQEGSWSYPGCLCHGLLPSYGCSASRPPLTSLRSCYNSVSECISGGWVGVPLAKLIFSGWSCVGITYADWHTFLCVVEMVMTFGRVGWFGCRLNPLCVAWGATQLGA